MKKIMLVLLGFSLIAVNGQIRGDYPPPLSRSIRSSHINSYDELKQDLKQAMFARQEGLMDNKEEYYKIVDVFLDKAEKELKAIDYCKEKPNSKLTKHFLTMLMHFNVEMFDMVYVSPRIYRTPCYASYMHCSCSYMHYLKETLTKISEKWKNFNVDDELRKITKLVEEGNKYYYSQLGWTIRLKLFAYRLSQGYT